jgi:hypothetical protein
MGQNIQSILVEVPLCIRAAMEPATNCLPTVICYRWYLVIMKAVGAATQVGGDVTVLILAEVKAVTAEALAVEALALALTARNGVTFIDVNTFVNTLN